MVRTAAEELCITSYKNSMCKNICYITNSVEESSDQGIHCLQTVRSAQPTCYTLTENIGRSVLDRELQNISYFSTSPYSFQT